MPKNGALCWERKSDICNVIFWHRRVSNQDLTHSGALKIFRGWMIRWVNKLTESQIWWSISSSDETVCRKIILYGEAVVRTFPVD